MVQAGLLTPLTFAQHRLKDKSKVRVIFDTISVKARWEQWCRWSWSEGYKCTEKKAFSVIPKASPWCPNHVTLCLLRHSGELLQNGQLKLWRQNWYFAQETQKDTAVSVWACQAGFWKSTGTSCQLQSKRPSTTLGGSTGHFTITLTTRTHARMRARAHAHARTHVRAHTHTVSDEGMGRAVKNSLERVIKQVRLESGFKRGGRIRVAECFVGFAKSHSLKCLLHKWAWCSAVRKSARLNCINLIHYRLTAGRLHGSSCIVIPGVVCELLQFAATQ